MFTEKKNVRIFLSAEFIFGQKIVFYRKQISTLTVDVNNKRPDFKVLVPIQVSLEGGG